MFKARGEGVSDVGMPLFSHTDHCRALCALLPTEAAWCGFDVGVCVCECRNRIVLIAVSVLCASACAVYGDTLHCVMCTVCTVCVKYALTEYAHSRRMINKWVECGKFLSLAFS